MNDSKLVRFSQNFLHSPRFVSSLLERTTISSDDTVYDIGGGKGIITAALADTCRAVISIEIDPQVARKLRAHMRERSNVVVYQADFMDFPLPTSPYKVFANIPFYLSSAITRRLVRAANPPRAAYMIVQKEFADMLTGKIRARRSGLAAEVSARFSVRVIGQLRPTDFYPRPRVESALMELTPRYNDTM